MVSVSTAYVLSLLAIANNVEEFQTWNSAKKVAMSAVAGALHTSTTLHGKWDPNGGSPRLTEGLDLSNIEEECECYCSNIEI